MAREEIEKVLDLHKKWLIDEVDVEGKKADLRGANLRGANLRSANLRSADLNGADLDSSCFPLWCGGIRGRRIMTR